MYEVEITNNETGENIEIEIKQLEFLKEVLKQFDETKIDVDLHYVDNAKVLKKEK